MWLSVGAALLPLTVILSIKQTNPIPTHRSATETARKSTNPCGEYRPRGPATCLCRHHRRSNISHVCTRELASASAFFCTGMVILCRLQHTRSLCVSRLWSRCLLRRPNRWAWHVPYIPFLQQSIPYELHRTCCPIEASSSAISSSTTHDVEEDSRSLVACRRSGILDRPAACLARFTVFFMSIAIVIGPTPPGTGVIAPATCDRVGRRVCVS